MGKLIPISIALIGLAAGVGAGVMLRPEASSGDAAMAPNHDLISGLSGQEGSSCGDGGVVKIHEKKPTNSNLENEFVKLANQFVFPLVREGKVAALMVLSLTLEVAPEQSDAVQLREPKLRDGFLRVLLDHANTGGFQGAFTTNETLDRLRTALLEKGQQILGDALYDVLILDINRQDA